MPREPLQRTQIFRDGATPRRIVRSLLVITLATASLAADAPRPRLEIVDGDRDLGVVAATMPTTAELTIANEGQAPLRATAGRPPRGVRIEPEEVSVAPGKSATFLVEIDTIHLFGPVDLRIPLTTTDPETPTTELRVRALIRTFVYLDPSEMRFFFVQGEPAGTIGTTLWSDDPAPFRVTSVESPLPSLAVKVRPAEGNERASEGSASQWRVEATLASDAPVGPLTGAIVLHLDHPKQTTIWIVLSGIVRPRFAVTPASVDLSGLAPTEGPLGTIDLQTFGTEAVSLGRVTSDVPGLLATAVEVVPGRRWRLDLGSAGFDWTRAARGTVRIETSDRQRPEIEIPVERRLSPPP